LVHRCIASFFVVNINFFLFLLFFLLLFFLNIIQIREASRSFGIKEFFFPVFYFFLEQDTGTVGTENNCFSQPDFICELEGEDHVTTGTDASPDGDYTPAHFVTDDTLKFEEDFRVEIPGQNLFLFFQSFDLPRFFRDIRLNTRPLFGQFLFLPIDKVGGLLHLLVELRQNSSFPLHVPPVLLFLLGGIPDFFIKGFVFPLGIDGIHVLFGLFPGQFRFHEEFPEFCFRGSGFFVSLVIINKRLFEPGQHFFPGR
jgi:hypothetical protein